MAAAAGGRPQALLFLTARPLAKQGHGGDRFATVSIDTLSDHSFHNEEPALRKVLREGEAQVTLIHRHATRDLTAELGKLNSRFEIRAVHFSGHAFAPTVGATGKAAPATVAC